MIDLEYVSNHLASVGRMIVARDGEDERDWRDGMDRSIDGIFKSLWAIVFAAPFALLSYVALRRAVNDIPNIDSSPLLDAPMSVYLSVQFLTYLIDWGISILTIVGIAKTVGAQKTITDTLITYNWAQVYAAGLHSIPVALMGLFASQALAGLLALPVMIVVLVIFWNVFRRAMGATPGIAVAMIILLTLINVIVSSLVSGVAMIFLQSSGG